MDDYVDDNDPISIKFQGIEMRGVNDRTGARSYPAMEDQLVDTRLGVPVHVFVTPGAKASPLVTLHDIGTNHYSFLSFCNYPEMRVILDNFTVYHVCAPGHSVIGSNGPRSPQGVRSASTDENFRLLSLAIRSGSLPSSDSATNSASNLRSILNYPTMDEMAEILADVVEHFELKYFLGFGVGAGANVLARYALLYPAKLLGLFLINPNDTTTGYYPWTKARWSDIPYLKSGVVTDWIQNWLLDHWFGSCTERNLDLEQSYLQLLDELNPVAVAGYIESYMNRSALGMTRPVSSLDTNVVTIKVDTFLVTGELATDLTRAMIDMNGNMDPTKTQFISVPDATGAVMDQVPGKLAILLLNYLRNLGMLVTVTPEKLQKAAFDRQVEQAKALCNSEMMQIRYECTDQC